MATVNLKKEIGKLSRRIAKTNQTQAQRREKLAGLKSKLKSAK